MTESREMTPENLRIIADWLDATDPIIAAHLGREEMGSGVQADIRRWADQLESK